MLRNFVSKTATPEALRMPPTGMSDISNNNNERSLASALRQLAYYFLTSYIEIMFNWACGQNKTQIIYRSWVLSF